MLKLLIAVCLCSAFGLGQEVSTRTVTGRVLDDSYRPLVGVRVSLMRPAGARLDVASAREREVGVTGADGRFALAVPVRSTDPHAGHPDVLTFEAQGRMMARMYAQEFHPFGGRASAVGPYDTGVVVLPRGESIQVRVRGAGGRPLAGALITGTLLGDDGHQGSIVWGGTEYFSRGVTDAKGSAVLHGPPGDALAVFVRAPGFYAKRVALQSPGMPLVVQLEASGLVTGRVVDHVGKPVRALLILRGESADEGFYQFYQKACPTNSDGKFQFNVDHRNRFVISAFNIGAGVMSGNGAPSFEFSEVLTGPVENLQIRFAKPSGVDGGVVVEVVDGDTGAPIKDGRIAMQWGGSVERSLLEMQFPYFSRPLSATGNVVLPHGSMSADRGRFMVKSPGYETHVSDRIEWREKRPVRLQVKMRRASSVSGRIVDATSGAALAGVEVWALRSGGGRNFSFAGLRSGAVWTDAKGRFRLDGLRRGRYEVRFERADRPTGEARKFEDGGEPVDLKLTLDIGHRFAGRIVGAEIGRGWRLVLESGSRMGAYVYPGRKDRHSGALAPDGGFTITGLSVGRYQPVLVMPRTIGPAIRVKLPESVRVSGAKEVVTIDVARSLPGRLRGKLEVQGIHPTRGRLVVCATPKEDDRVFGVTGMTVPNGPKCTVGQDGAFALRLAAGSYNLRLYDALTKVTLHREPLEIEAGGKTAVSLSLGLALVRIRMVPKSEGGEIVASRLEVRIANESGVPGAKWAEDFGVPRPGVSIADGRREVLMYLPPREFEFRVVSTAHQLLRQPMPPFKSVRLGGGSLTPKMSEVNTLEIEVAPPPAIGKLP